MELLEIRDQLDKVDQEIVKLYKKRMDLCKEVAEIKLKTGKQVFDPEREKQKLDNVAGLLTDTFDKKAIRELYRQMMTVSRRLQLGVLAENGKSYASGFRRIPALDKSGRKVVYQGAEGAYAQLAALQCFGTDVEYVNVRTWKDACEMVAGGRADYAVLPIENSSHGMVSDTFDLLLQYPNAIVSEVDLRVEHALMGIRGAETGKLRAVYSHPQALSQCSAFFERHPEIEAVPVLNTAVAAKLVSEQNNPEIAALASEQSAALYGLDILERSVNQEKTNTTRFIVAGREQVYTEASARISLCFETAHQPGALYNVLGNFIFNDVNMTMIQSRPVPERAFEYRFFVDIEGRLDQPDVMNALSGIQDQITSFRILGCY